VAGRRGPQRLVGAGHDFVLVERIRVSLHVDLGVCRAGGVDGVAGVCAHCNVHGQRKLFDVVVCGTLVANMAAIDRLGCPCGPL
jgi:hypothetical protein